jgi:cytidylate kinase
VLDAGVDPVDEAGLKPLLGRVRIELADDGRVLLGGQDVASRIRTQEVGQAASKLSSLRAVRAALIALQRKAARPPGTVAEGRDMGTVVFPDASLKIFLDADADERARRRAAELSARGENADPARVKAEMGERDRRDRTRSLAPLVAAPDAVVMDSTTLSADEVVARIVAEARRRATSRSTKG